MNQTPDPKTTLHTTLTGQRQHVLAILETLDEDAVHRAVLPSGWTTAGLVSHLTVDDERFWFRAVVGGDPTAAPDPSENAWNLGADLTGPELLQRYRDEIRLADAVIASIPLDQPVRWWPDGLFGDWHPSDLHEVMLHMITETACHAGHLDAARELIDGGQWLVLD